MKLSERVIATLYHKELDKVPCIFAATSRNIEIIEKFKVRLLQSDMTNVIQFEVMRKSEKCEILKSSFGSIHYYEYEKEYMDIVS